MKTPRILIVAGSDSGGGAGIQADIKTVTMLGGHAMTAITAITAQNTLGVQAVMQVPAEMVLAQIDSVVSDIGVDAVKIGMIGSAETAHAVADRLEGLAIPIVFDPVMVATSGSMLADAPTIAAFERLMRIASVTTPNKHELEALWGSPIGSESDQSQAAEEVMLRTGSTAILAKGGHWGEHVLVEDEDGKACHYPPGSLVTDRLYAMADGWQEWVWDHEHVATRHTHGTGCTLASGIAAGLASDLSLPDAVIQARAFVLQALKAAPGLGSGHGPMGHALGIAPFDLLRPKG